MNYNYLQQGGLTSLPIRPVLAGQQHELSYITPEEAQLLRQYGGGVTPSGGQYRGPGGIASFSIGPPSVSTAGPPTATPSTSSPKGKVDVRSHYSPYGNVHADIPGTPEFGEGMFSVDKADKAAIFSILSLDDMSKMNPKSLQSILGDPKGFLSGSVGSDGEAFTGSMHDKVRSALDNGMVDVTTHGLMDSTFGHVTALSPAQAANPIGIPAQDRINVGVVGSGLSKAVHGLTDILGLIAPPIGLVSSLMSSAQMLGLLGDDHDTFGDIGLMSLIGDMIGDISTGDDGSTVSSDLSNFGDRFAEATGLQDVSDFSQGLISQAETAVDTAWSGSDLQAATQSVRSAVENVGEAIGEGISSVDLSLPNIDLSLPNIDLGDWGLGDWGLGDLSLGDSSSVPQGEGGGPGTAMPPPPPQPVEPPYQSPTFINYPDRDPSESESVYQVPLTLQAIRDRYIASSPTVTAQEGGGIQGLINNQNKEYSIRNQSNVPSFNKATPDPDLTSGSHGYISNILKGHTVPMGMTNVQQMQKPIEAFPTGGQMNTANTQYADYSKPQSFYATPNMNRIT